MDEWIEVVVGVKFRGGTRDYDVCINLLFNRTYNIKLIVIHVNLVLFRNSCTYTGLFIACVCESEIGYTIFIIQTITCCGSYIRLFHFI